MQVSAGSIERSVRARWARKRTSEAELHARLVVDKAPSGRRRAEEPSIEALQICAALESSERPHLGLVESRIGCREAEAGESPSSEAPPEIRDLEDHVTEGVERRRGYGAEGREIGNLAAYRVLVSEVGCRSRRDASFS